jgi:hypothetical protein
MPACIDVLAEAIGDKAAAARPSALRRIALDNAGNVVLSLEAPVTWLSEADLAFDRLPDRGPKRDAWLATEQRAWPIDEAVDLMNSSESPEAEVGRRRAKALLHDQREAKARTEAEARAEAERKQREEREAHRIRFREFEWNALAAEARLLVRMSLAIEKHAPELATALHVLAMTPGDLGLPACEWWLVPEKRTTDE